MNKQTVDYEAGVSAVVAAVEAALKRHATEFYTPSLRVEAVHADAIRDALAPFKDGSA